ncbi:MAG: hypothetical protein OXC69_09965 [Candidatus Tectomicrobia bacterium]|nr:hypothetical protein [Candidatus Tectomicrobia bacterium]
MSEPSQEPAVQVPEALRRHVETSFTRDQMAAAYGCDQETISRWVANGQLPRPIRYGARDIWTLESLEEYRRKRAQQAQEENNRLRHLTGRIR